MNNIDQDHDHDDHEHDNKIDTKTAIQWPAGDREKEGGGEESQEPAACVKVRVDCLKINADLKIK